MIRELRVAGWKRGGTIATRKDRGFEAGLV